VCCFGGWGTVLANWADVEWVNRKLVGAGVRKVVARVVAVK